MKDKEFNDFIDAVENGEIQGRGLLVASLDYRTALRIAFEAGHGVGFVKGYEKGVEKGQASIYFGPPSIAGEE